MQELFLVTPMPPSVNAYLRTHSYIKNGQAYSNSYTTLAAKNYKQCFAETIKRECKKQNFSLIENKRQHIYVDCTFYFARVNQDPNNYFKLLCDAITDSGCVWHDDNVCCERVNAIYYDASNPRIELHIYPVEYVGIFASREQLIEFETHCKDCSRYREGRCSLLLRAQEGYVSKEITATEMCPTCSAYKLRKKGKSL